MNEDDIISSQFVIKIKKNEKRNWPILLNKDWLKAVSYTHLDVYKRQWVDGDAACIKI